MNYSDIATALDTQLLTVVAEADLQQENERRTGATSDFIRSTLLPGQNEIASLGPNGYDRVRGLYQVDIFKQIGAGSGAALTQADLILAAFVKGNYLTSNSIKVLIENKWLIPARNLQNFYQTSIIIQWSSYQV
jgi:hypothetical protein